MPAGAFLALHSNEEDLNRTMQPRVVRAATGGSDSYAGLASNSGGASQGPGRSTS